MLKVECESCKAPYQVDERRVPPTGLKMRCPKCGHTFLVTDPSKDAVGGSGDPSAPKPAGGPVKKATMVGVGGFGGMAPPPVAKAPPAPAPKAAPAAFDDDFGLPAVKPAAAKPPVPAPKPAAPPAPLPGLDDLDLPALAGDVGVGLPARSGGKPPAPKPMAAPKPAPPPAPFGAMDLPAAKPAAAAPAPFGSVDLPAAKQHADLPSAKGGGGFGSIDLPAPKDAGGFADLPQVHQSPTGNLPMAKGGGGFGEIDLPSVQNDLPTHMNQTAHLPATMNANAHLPATMNANAHLPTHMNQTAHLPATMNANAHLPSAMHGNANLPTAMGANAHLPAAMAAQAHLPAPMGAQAHLPSAMGPNAHLPSAMSPNAHLPAAMGAQAHLPSLGGNLPTAMGAQAHMPAPVSDDRLLPNRGGAPPPVSFGELDLPLVGGGSAESPPKDAVSFGDLDLPNDPTMGGTQLPGSSPPPKPGAAPGGMAFGEVDLGGGDGQAVLGPPPATSAGSFAFQEASLEAPKPTTKARPEKADRPSSKLPKILAVFIVLLVVGGAALQFTPVGAFGMNYLSDKFRASEYLRNTQTLGDTTRKKLATDTFSSARGAADELFDAKKKTPRSKPLAAYTAFVEFENQVRFGADSGRAARARTFLQEIPAADEVPYRKAALAAQEAAAGDWAKASSALALAVAKEPKDGIQLDLTILKGEIALAQRDSAGALAAFEQAHASGKSARTQFGIARAHFQAKSYTKAKEAVEATLKLTPSHAGALTLRALLVWEAEHDDAAPMKDLAAVLDDNARKTQGPSDISNALAAKGWILLARDRAGDARAAFDEAVKMDSRNASALVGQGEVLYAESRATEALTRFDEALSKDPANVTATIGSAKSKVALERLADAKTQLTAARAAWPKEMGIALWLAKTEEALGNRKPAEELYTAAIDLADPTNPDAIQAYAAFARFLANQGRANEAQAKLEQARTKLPDSAGLRRAFGEVALAQGQYELAVQHFESVLQKTPNDLGTRFRLGSAYRKMNRLDKAAAELDQVAAIDKEYPNIALERGLLFEATGDVQKALEQFNGALQKAPNDPDLKLRVGAAYVSIGETEKAIPMLKEVLGQRPNSAEVNHFLGRAYLRQGGLDSAAAMRYLQRAVDLDPNHAEYHLYVAWAANEASPAQLGLARKHVDKALQLDKLLADGYWQRGVVELREGQVIDAVKDLKRALDLKPTRHEAHAALAEAYEQKNDLRGAMGEWARAIAGDSKPAMWRFRYGKLLAESGKAGDAVKHLTYAVTEGKSAQPRPGWLGQAAFEAADVQKRTGQKKDACDNYNLYMELAGATSPDRKDALRAMEQLGCPYEGR